MNEKTKKIVITEENPTQCISTHAPHASFTHFCSAGSCKIITPQAIHPHPKPSKVMAKRRQGVASEINTSPLYEKMAKKEHEEEEIKKKEEKAAKRKARAEE